MSNISCGIIGLPNVGKSTLFNALTKNNALAANYPFATIEPNTGIAMVPDNRLDGLAKLFKNPKIVHANIKFVDIAGLVEGASRGEGLGNQFLSHIRTVDLIIHVVRSFRNQDIDSTHTSNPKQDIEVINTELVLADLQSLDKRLSKVEKEAKSNPKTAEQLKFYKQIKSQLESGKPIWNNSESDLDKLSDLQLITTKKVVYFFNVAEGDLNDKDTLDDLGKIIEPNPFIVGCAKLENELNSLNTTDSVELLKSYGQSESSLIKLVSIAYSSLGLQSFLTAGEQEVRAWTIKLSTTAKEAAGVIHQDFSRGFIAADIVNYHDLVESGSFNNARVKGKVRTEGKEYLMKPDDVVLFKFNV